MPDPLDLDAIRVRWSEVRKYDMVPGAEAQDDIDRLLNVIEALQAWVSDLQSGLFINCVYCGHRYGPAGSVPATLVENPPPTTTMADALRDHIERCPKHPMSALRKSVEALCAALSERGYHAPIHHYWYRGQLVVAPPGVHGERCDKCEPALALIQGGTHD